MANKPFFSPCGHWNRPENAGDFLPTANIKFNQGVCRISRARCGPSRAMSMAGRPAQTYGGARKVRRDTVRSSSQGGAWGDFISRSRDAHKVRSEGHQLANPGDAGYFRDQLVHDGPDRSGGIDRRPGDHHQDRLVLPSRTPLGVGNLGAALIAGPGMLG